ncbi:major histocompatibility complex class I-related gene protein [Poecilia reticulata]|uniref:major histocompatibility complex class I-related gene protein n=1 Tax=Poecilia reticulata TaxID=8081 RepID=UPI0007E9B509|nr:PREDICTED: major histocompatibility complex class I-related gene protein-like [Poecilia reticulata]
MSAGLLDDVQISYCDSIANRNIPKQDWMNNVSSDNPHYWEEETLTCLAKQETLKENIEIAKLRFNQTGGVHIVQRMYGCEWDDESQQVTSYNQYGYDGEDFLTLDMESNRWIAPKQQAVLTTNKWNSNTAELEYRKNYLNQECPDWLKKYVDYGRSSLMRTVRPSVSLLRKFSSSPVSCHATGFYPNRAEMFWRKNGEEIHDGVEKGEIVPNNDGTFQMSAHIDLSSVPTEDWSKYECVFQLSGDKEDVTNRLEKTRILTNESNTPNVIILVVAAVAVLGLIAVIGFIVYKKKNAKRPPSPVVNGQPPEETQFLPQA